MELKCALLLLLLGVLGMQARVESRRARLAYHSEKTALHVRTPSDKQESYEVILADFGIFPYGATFEGIAVYLNNEYSSTERSCGEFGCQYGCNLLRNAKPPYVKPDEVNSYILVVDRGPRAGGDSGCSFIQKARNAQDAGFSGIIVLSDRNTLTTMEETGDDLGKRMEQELEIPAVLMTRSKADRFREAFALQDGEEPLVRVSIDFKKPAPESQKVAVDLWMTAKDNCGQGCANLQSVVKGLTPYIKELVKENRVDFSARFITWVCPEYKRQSNDCKNRCIFSNRYCAPDPENDMDKGYTGADVAMENLRQMCLQRVLKDNGMSSTLWLDYINLFWDECNMAENLFSEDCSNKVFSKIVGSKHIEEWHACFGDPVNDEESEIFEEELENQINDGGSSIAIDPTFRVNKEQYRGSLVPEAIMKHVCASFLDLEEPEICDQFVSVDRCQEGQAGYDQCNSQEYVDAHMTRCENAYAGHICRCDAGYVEKIGKDGATKCEKEASQAGVSVGAILAIAIACIIVVVAIAAGSHFYHRRRNDRYIRETMKEYLRMDSQGGGARRGGGAPVYETGADASIPASYHGAEKV